MAKSDGKRPDRVGERIREELSTRILRGELHDPRAADAVISAVKVSEDLSVARVYVRSLHPLDARDRDGLLQALGRAAGFLRRSVGAALGTRTVPELRFAWDESIDRAASIEKLLAEISDERKAPSREDET